MRNLCRLMCVILMAVAFSACSNNGPDKVAVKFYKALYTGDVKETVKLTTETSRAALTMMLKITMRDAEECKKTNPQINVLQTDISESGSSAKVELEISDFYDSYTKSISDETIRGTINLVKINDEWKVALDF